MPYFARYQMCWRVRLNYPYLWKTFWLYGRKHHIDGGPENPTPEAQVAPLETILSNLNQSRCRSDYISILISYIYVDLQENVPASRVPSLYDQNNDERFQRSYIQYALKLDKGWMMLK